MKVNTEKPDNRYRKYSDYKQDLERAKSDTTFRAVIGRAKIPAL